jgi:CBS domain containing-hemolysin-like protein
VGAGRGLERAWEMTEKLEIYLSGCQVGITVCSVGLGVVAEPAVTAILDPVMVALGFSAGGGAQHTTAAVIVGFAIINLLHVIVGEQAPTYFGIERTKLATKYGSLPLLLWSRLMYPVIFVADKIAKGLLGLFGVTISRSWAEEEVEGEEDGGPSSRAEVRAQMGETMSRMGLPDDRREEVLNALRIGQTTVSEIMVDIDDVVPLRRGDSLDANLDRIEEFPHVRYPLVGDSFEEYVGIVYAPLVLRNLEALQSDEMDLSDVAASPLTVAADTSVSDLIDQFQTENQELALVVSEGEIVGMVTATDAFEEITGELEDPIDTEILGKD